MADDLPPLPSLPLGHYRHYKGGEYDVLGVVRHSESLEPLVLYRPRQGQAGDWVRPHALFTGSITHGGITQPRFAAVAEAVGTMPPDLGETVQRMEARLAASPRPTVRQLMHRYESLAHRFEQDLAPSARDVQLAKAGALMLVQALAREAEGAPLADAQPPASPGPRILRP